MHWRAHRIPYNPAFRNLDVFHGHSHELPYGIFRATAFKVITIHDLIFEYYPQDYAAEDRRIYKSKFRYACLLADAIIAIRNETKDDIIKYLGISRDKIRVIYQSCDPQFHGPVADAQVCEVRELIRVRHLENARHWISPAFDEFPAIYKGTRLFILPSYYEGFGIPLSEAMSTGTPVITSDQSALTEVVGDAGIKIPPDQPEAIREAIDRVSTDEQLCNLLITKGKERARAFLPGQLPKQIMDVYQRTGV